MQSDATRAGRAPRQWPTWVKLALFCSSLAVWLAVQVVPLRKRALNNDFSGYLVAAKVVKDGNKTHLYDYEFWGDPPELVTKAAGELGLRQDIISWFVYPPLVADLFAPFLWLPSATVVNVWAAVNALVLLAVIFLSIRLYVPRYDNAIGWSLALLAATVFEPIRENMLEGQMSGLVVLSIVGSFTLLRAERPIVAGIAMSVGALLKLSPALFIIVWLWRGPRRAAGSLAVSLAVLAVVSLTRFGWPTHLAYLDQLSLVSSKAIVAYNNHSLRAFFCRFQ